MEIFRKKNEATIICFPMVNVTTPETFDTGETVTDTAYYSDAEGTFTTLAITDTVSEIGTTGVYEISLSQTEMNHDLVMIKFTSAAAADTSVLIRTRAVDLDDVVRSTTPANTLDVSAGGEAGLDWANIGSPTTAQDLSGTNIDVDQVVASVSGAVGSVSALAAGIINNTSVGTLDNTNFAFVDSNERIDVGQWLGTAATSGTGGPDVNVNAIGDSTTAATNAVIVYATDFGANYNQTDNAWVTNGANWNVGKTGYELIADSSAVTIGTVNALAAGSIDDTSVGTLTNSNFAFVDANERVDVGSVLSTPQTAGDLAALITVVDAVVDSLNLGIIYGVAQTGTLTTTACTSDQAGNFADDELIGRVIVFTGGTADGQAAVITDYANTAGLITFANGVTTAPLNNDTFKIV